MTPREATLIGTAEAARILGVTRRTGSRLGLEPVVKLPGATGAALYALEDVQRLAEERAA